MTAFYKEIQKPDLLQDITYSEGKVLCKLDDHLKFNSNKSLTYSLRLVPFYTEFKIGGYLYRKISQSNWNYGVSTKGLTSVDEYLKTQFNANGRKVILRNIRRLEICFDIRYELYFGSIAEHTYTLLMNALRSMIKSRFEEKGENSKDTKDWDHIFQCTLSKIRNKSASLFVIYHGQEPIEISLNYHYEGILFSSVSSFDTDYSKFGLGQIEIFKQLEWCIDNNYHFFEMGVGGMDYKRRWSNEIHAYNHYVFFTKEIVSRSLGYLEYTRIRLKEFLKSIKLNDFIYSLISVFSKNTIQKSAKNEYSLRDCGVNLYTDLDQRDLIEVALKDYSYLKRPVNDFLYLTQEHVSKISILEVVPKCKFLLRGEKSLYELKFD